MTDDCIEIIKVLRKTGFGWIADEVVESIALGRQTTKQFREAGMARAIRASAIMPFTPEEEMGLIVETLAQYFIVVPSAWRTARACFADRSTFAEVQLGEQAVCLQEVKAVGEPFFAATLGIAGEGEPLFHDLDPGYRNESLPAVRRVLSKLWPKGVEDFEKQFTEEKAKKE